MNKDVLFLLALEMDDPSILNFCRSSKKFNEIVCNNNNFWRQKIEKERPGLLNLISNINVDYKDIYRDLKFNNYVCSIKFSLNPLEIYGVIQGILADYGFYTLDYCNGKIGDKIWVVFYNDPEFEPYSNIDKNIVLNITLHDIDMIYEDLINEGHNLKNLEYYHNQIITNGYVKIGNREFLMKEFTIL